MCIGTLCIIIMNHQRRQFNQSIQLQHLRVDLSAFSAFHIRTLQQNGEYGSLVVIARKFYSIERRYMYMCGVLLCLVRLTLLASFFFPSHLLLKTCTCTEI